MINRRLPTLAVFLLMLSLFSFHSELPAGAIVSSPQAITIQLEPVLSGLTDPLYVGHAGDGSNRLFIVERLGIIKVLQPGSMTPTVFLDIATRVLSGGEQGLLGLAFHPNYETNGRFFVNYTRKPDGATVIAEYRVSPSNPNVANTTEIFLLGIAQPFANHNGGMIEFGPDGYLYIATGDGGSADDPGNRAQNINELLGKMLRIDVDHPNGPVPYSSPSTNPFAGAIAGADEIYAYGLRNPWRFSFDRGTGQLFVGDVGQGAREEIDIIVRGGNYGWRIMEGTICNPSFNQGICTQPPNYIAPLTEYSHLGGRCSVTGGYVYRGQIGTLPLGAYVFGDFCTGEIFTYNNSQLSLLLDTARNISSFGEGEAGEIYLLGLGGTLERIFNPNAPCSFAITPVSKSIPGPGGTASVLVTTPAGCNWTATSNAGFIHITSGASGTGRGLVTYFVDPINGPTSRSGTITIAGKIFTINQTADSDGDGIPDTIEPQEGTNPSVKDNDIFTSARLFVMQQYRDFFGREGEPGGISFWSEKINNGAATRAQIIETFLNSGESGPVAAIARLYLAYFLRIPDYAGLIYWVNQYRAGTSLESISQTFASSTEFDVRYGGLSNEDYVRLLYRNVLGREADAEGLAFWAGKLNSGQMTRGQVMLGFSESDEFKHTSGNRVFVIRLYAGLLGRSPQQAGLDFWQAALDGGASRLDLIQQFIDSAEYHNRFLP